MSRTDDLLNDFPPVGTDTWQENIAKTLKAKPISDLTWSVDRGVQALALYRKPAAPFPKSSTKLKESNYWSIAHFVDVQNLKKSNAEILRALFSGVNVLSLKINTDLDAKQLQTLLKGVYTNMVQIFFELESNVDLETFLKQLENLTGSESNIRGGCSVEINQLTKLPETSHSLTYFTCSSTATSPVDSLVDLLNQGRDYLQKFMQQGHDVDELSQHFRFQFRLSDSYLLEIARLRAFRRLWWGVLEAYNAQSPRTPHIWASTHYGDANHKYWNMIAATTQAMAAAIGGVDTLIVCPAGGYSVANAFTRRIAVNIQHLLQQESYLDRVVDPASGSYYIENMTIDLQKAAWKRFTNN